MHHLGRLTAPRRCQRRGMVSESLGLTSHKSSCNCTGCGMVRAGVCINCAEKTAALILEAGPGELAVEPCSGACREAIELYFSTPPERWSRAAHALSGLKNVRGEILIYHRRRNAHCWGKCSSSYLVGARMR